MSGVFTVSVQEARGLIAVPANIDRLAVVMGCSSAGAGLSPFFLSGSAAVVSRGYGDAVDTIAQCVEQKQDSGTTKKYPVAFYTLPVTTNGSYGAIDQTGVTGTAVTAFGAAHPFGTYQPRLRVTKGGLVGTAGIEFRHSLDDGRNESRVTALGTATSFTIPNSNVQFEFSPSPADLTALDTLLDELKTDFNAHRILIAGGVHGAADNVNAVTAANATDTASRVALANDLRAQYSAHRIDIAGGIHGAADTVDVITAPVATDDSTALMLALDIKAKYNAHRVLTAGGVHGAADNTNATTSPNPSAGAFVLGDIVKGRTFGPAPAAADIDAAFTALAAASIDFRLVICDFACNAALAAHISSGLGTLRNAGKMVTALARTRIPDFENNETDAAWNASIAADFAGFNDSSITFRSAYLLTTDAMTSRQYLRQNFAQFCADVIRVDRSEFPDVPADQPMANCKLVDATGTTIGHDEGTRGASTGLSDDSLGNRFCCDMRLPDYKRREDVFSTVPWVMYADDERIRNLPTRRIANAMEALAVSAGNSGLGGKLFYIPAKQGDPNSHPTLTAPSRAAIQGVVYQALKKEFANDIENADDAGLDTGLVQINPVVSVSGGNLLSITGTLAPVVAGYLLNIGFTLAVQE